MTNITHDEWQTELQRVRSEGNVEGAKTIKEIMAHLNLTKFSATKLAHRLVEEGRATCVTAIRTDPSGRNQRVPAYVIQKETGKAAKT